MSRNDIASNKRPLVSIVAPAFNEAGILKANLTKICQHMETLQDRYLWELIVVDDGSNDGSGELAQAFAAPRNNVRVHQHPINFGLGQALCSGFNQSRGEYIVVMDIDLTYAPDHIEKLLERISATGAKIVLASPYMKGGRTTKVPFFRKLLSRWGNRFLSLAARGGNRSGNISTLTGMVRAYDARFIRSLNLKSMGMEINTEVLHKAMILGARIEEIPAHLDWSNQQNTKSIRTSSQRIRRSVLFSLFAGYSIRPLVFFIIPAALLALVSLYTLGWFAYHVIIRYQDVVQAGANLDFTISKAVALAFQQSPHSLIVGGITLVLSVQLFSLGILALQVKHHFEELFHFSTRIYSQLGELGGQLKERGGSLDVTTKPKQE